MTLNKSFLLLAVTILLAAASPTASAQNLTYAQMTPAQRAAFVSQQARRLGREMSGNNYQFTPAFEAAIMRSVDFYVQRMDDTGSDQVGRNTRAMFERGQTLAPTLRGIFKAHNVSPLIGIYIPAVESAYVNIQSANSVGAVGMFQFLPKTGEHFGLSAKDLLDVEKSANAAARYIAAGIKQFENDPMKEVLAILAYNRGGSNVERDLELLVNPGNRACSICVLTEQRDKLDANFQNESVYYVPRFFAAAIIGENPDTFGLQLQPLSTISRLF
ncbi:MAG TPA: transglycosylase SLT domain-containing protein [Pyrinomonadaceae bacterium]|nr:transglycosylase SLT domain-containing protein [Pyrinomonadaceae bacterium]